MRVKELARSLTVAAALAVGAMSTAAIAAPEAALVAEATNRYYVYFEEAGAYHYQGSIPGLERTANERSGIRFDGNRSEVRAYRDYLADVRQQRIADFEQLLGRSLVISYEYDITVNALVVESISAADAQVLAAHPSVRSVEIVKDYELATDRGPAFIGADTIWLGTSTPGGTGYRGEGMVIGVLDTGVNTSHPSFANDASCGFDAGTPKLIAAKDCLGSATCTGANPVDGNGHGSHTAATAGGNTHTATGGALAGFEVSGVAPCARLITYKVCATNNCDGAAITAAINNALLDGLDAVNYSISGGTSPWTDADRGFLDLVDSGIFVAASAGNTSATITNPIGQVNHRGPWVMTVANSTHDRINSNAVSLDQGGPQDIYGLKGEMTIAADIVATVADAQALGNVEGCNPGFTAGSMTGRIALIRRGTCNFSEKINNAQTAGAVGVIVFNSNVGQPPILMGQTAGLLAAVMVSNADGLAIQSHVTNNPTSQATISSTTVVATDPGAGDILNAGSLRGPIAGGIEVTKPDITGPGTNIYAAVAGGATAYDFLTGTSMSGPHVAGGGALVKGLQPNWSVIEVKSAIQMTAVKDGFKDFVNGTPNSGPWDADDVGNGRIDLSKAALAGLVLHETTANFLAASGNQAAQRALNLPSMRNTSCTPNCTWTRTVRNTLATPTSWTASGVNFGPGLSVNVSPTNFSFTGNTSETQVLTITATPNGNQTAAVVFGEVVLVETGSESPDLHMTVAIRGQGAGGTPAIEVDPTSISGTGTAGSGTPVARPLNINNVGGGTLIWSQTTLVINSRGTPGVVWDQPVDGTQGIISDFYTVQNTGAISANDFVLTADTAITEIFTPGFDNTNSLAAQSQITWQIYPDAAGVPAGNPLNAPGAAVWSYSSAVNGPGVSIADNNILLNLIAAGEDLDLAPGTYWLTVFPTYNDFNAVVGADPVRWNWSQALQVGELGQLISPVLFSGAAPDWTPISSLTAGAIVDTAFTLTGIQGTVTCGAPWLSMDPTSGSVASGGTDNVNVLLDSSALTQGTYNANLCIDSNDPDNPTTVVPVTFNVDEGVPSGEADLSISMSDIPDPVNAGGELSYIVNVANFGPDTATEIEVFLDLPPELSFDGHVTSMNEKHLGALRGGSWACAPSGSTVTCVLSGSVAATELAPTLEVITTVSASAAPGMISTTGTVSSAEDDLVPGNNSVTIQTEVVGEPDLIFANGFECADGLPDCPVGNPDIVVIDDIDFVPNADFTGGSILWVDGSTCACDTAPFNLNVYGTATTLQYFWPNNANNSEGGVTLDGGTTYAVLGSGATIGPASSFLVGTAVALTAPWSVPGNADGYLGFRFLDGAITKYGYAHITTGTNGRPLTIHSVTYNDVGDPITIP